MLAQSEHFVTVHSGWLDAGYKNENQKLAQRQTSAIMAEI